MEVVNDFGLTYDQMLIVEKYERVMNYLYQRFAENLMIFSRQDECEHFNQSKNH